MSHLHWLVASTASAALAAGASAGVTITQGTSAPTYTDYTLNFDEAGGPTGLVPQTAWLGSHGITVDSGTGDPFVGDFSGDYPWINSGKALFANFGFYMTSQNDITALSLQVWDPSGPPGPIGGGLFFVVRHNGADVGSGGFTPAWGGIGQSWFNITTDGGTVFDEIVVYGNGFVPTTFVDNLSWNVVPSPAGIALLGLAGLAGRRRRA